MGWHRERLGPKARCHTSLGQRPRSLDRAIPRGLKARLIRFSRVIEDPECSHEGDQTDDVLVTAKPALADSGFGDGVAASGEALRHALKMQIHGHQPDRPDIELVAVPGGLHEELGDGFAAEGGFGSEVGVGAQGLLQLGFPVGPGNRVGFFLGDRRQFGADQAGMFVGIEIGGTGVTQGLTSSNCPSRFNGILDDDQFMVLSPVSEHLPQRFLSKSIPMLDHTLPMRLVLETPKRTLPGNGSPQLIPRPARRKGFDKRLYLPVFVKVPSCRQALKPR
jgi:hypothetical protein